MRSLAIFLVLLAIPAVARADDLRAGAAPTRSNAAQPFLCDSVLASDCFKILFRRLEIERLRRGSPARCDARDDQAKPADCDNGSAPSESR